MIDKRSIKNIEELKIYLDAVKGWHIDHRLLSNGEKVYYGIAW